MRCTISEQIDTIAKKLGAEEASSNNITEAINGLAVALGAEGESSNNIVEALEKVVANVKGGGSDTRFKDFVEGTMTSAYDSEVTRIGRYTFQSCYNLVSLYLTGSTVCTLANNSAFMTTPIGGYSASAGQYGSIYVPESLVATYKAATNWSYFSDRFVGI